MLISTTLLRQLEGGAESPLHRLQRLQLVRESPRRSPVAVPRAPSPPRASAALRASDALRATAALRAPHPRDSWDGPLPCVRAARAVLSPARDARGVAGRRCESKLVRASTARLDATWCPDDSGHWEASEELSLEASSRLLPTASPPLRPARAVRLVVTRAADLRPPSHARARWRQGAGGVDGNSLRSTRDSLARSNSGPLARSRGGALEQSLSSSSTLIFLHTAAAAAAAAAVAEAEAVEEEEVEDEDEDAIALEASVAQATWDEADSSLADLSRWPAALPAGPPGATDGEGLRASSSASELSATLRRTVPHAAPSARASAAQGSNGGSEDYTGGDEYAADFDEESDGGGAGSWRESPSRLSPLLSDADSEAGNATSPAARARGVTGPIAREFAPQASLSAVLEASNESASATHASTWALTARRTQLMLGMATDTRGGGAQPSGAPHSAAGAPLAVALCCARPPLTTADASRRWQPHRTVWHAVGSAAAVGWGSEPVCGDLGSGHVAHSACMRFMYSSPVS